MNVAQQLIQRRRGRGMLAVTVNTRGKKAAQTKTPPYARCGPTFCANARLILEVEGNRTAGRTHVGVASIDRGSTIANANSQITEKLFTSDFASQAEDSRCKFDGWEIRRSLEFCVDEHSFVGYPENRDPDPLRIAELPLYFAAAIYSAALNAAQR